MQCYGAAVCATVFAPASIFMGVEAGDGLPGAGLVEGKDGPDLVPHGFGFLLRDHQGVKSACGVGQVEFVGAVAVAEQLVGGNTASRRVGGWDGERWCRWWR